MVTSLHLFLHDDFRPHDRELTSNDRARAILGTLGGPNGYTFAVLWRSDTIDGLDDLDAAIAIAVARALEDPAGGARVQIEAPIDGALAGRRRDAWVDRVIFVAAQDAASLRRYR